MSSEKTGSTGAEEHMRAALESKLYKCKNLATFI